MPKPFFEPEVLELSFPDGLDDRQLEALFANLCGMQHAIFLDGSGIENSADEINRYSFLAADPIDRLVVHPNDHFGPQQIRDLVSRYPFDRVAGLPPFQGGVAGLLGYELNSRLDKVAPSRIDEFNIPQLALFVYDVVVAVDHQQSSAWIVSQGWPERDITKRKVHAKRRLEAMQEVLVTGLPPMSTSSKEHSRISWDSKDSAIVPRSSMNRLDATVELYSDFSKLQFLQMVERAVEYVHAGDIFQTNLSQRLLTPASKSSPDLYLDLRSINPAPFSTYLDFGDGQVISASPERLVSMHDGQIESRPIKGTRRRTHFPEVDLNMREELLRCEKDRSENIMIVDLMRNDLSKVSKADSVQVSKLCGIEQFENVLHLVSVVQATLNPDYDATDLVTSIFPGGSVTGAPKIRAMEIIAEMEPTVRGAYCGSIGYICPDGDLDFNILIRTITAKGGWWQIPVGGGIVSDSDPEKEYEETWTKAIGMLRAIERKFTGSQASPMPIGQR